MLALLVLGGCAATNTGRPPGGPGIVAGADPDAAPSTSGPGGPAPEPSTDFESTREPWDFNGTAGWVLGSANYRLHTTGRKSWMHEYALRFAEQALAHYRTAIADLPAPSRPLEVFLFGDREEWKDHTRTVMKDNAELYLNLGRGGYATRGMAVLYDISFNDTFAIMAHEGWHQYTQVTFQHPLPTWLEEGLATYMEGRRQIPGRSIEFLPWLNPQRMGALRRAYANRQIIPLVELLDRSPQYFLERDGGRDSTALLTYYAQVWALTHFLVSGENGRYRDGLERALRDAAAGKLVSTILNSSAIPRTSDRRRLATSPTGAGVLLTYFSGDLGEFGAQYERFIEELVTEQAAGFPRANAGALDGSER